MIAVRWGMGADIVGDNVYPSNARLSRRGRSRLRRGEGAPNAEAIAPPDVIVEARAPVSEAAKTTPATHITPSVSDAVDPPFDPPDVDDILGVLSAPEDDPPPLHLRDPLAKDELLLVPGGVDRRGQYTPPPKSALTPNRRAEDELVETPVPPIRVYASWDRPAMAEQLAHFAADKHLARADITIERGGLDGAIAWCAARPAPHLIIVDTTLDAPPMLDGLDRLLQIVGSSAKIIIIGAVNDVGLLRELASRGVAEYIVPPSRRNDLIRAAC